MEVKYKRDMNRNYMILQLQKNADYQLKMICENEIKGLLPVHTGMFNGISEIYYDISSRQPISRLYAKKEIKKEDIYAILRAANDLLENIKRFLLDGCNILFEPDFCYCNPENGKTEWVFFPGEKKECSFMEIAEFFIERVDHRDSKAVDTAYCFFKRAKEENFSLSQFVDEMIMGAENIETEMVENVSYDYETIAVQDSENEKKRSITLVEKIQNYIKGKIENRIVLPEQRRRDSLELQNGLTWENYGLSENYNGETLVMGVSHEPLKRQLTSLTRDSTECISLSKLPCILGKMPECSDVVLQDKSVSRMHARFFEENGDVYLQDLNSTNGSFLNGLQLETNEVLKIKIGDEIGFGNLRYRYE